MTKEQQERDDRLLAILARLRVMVFEQVVRLCFNGVESTAHATLIRYARPDKHRPAYLHYFYKNSKEHPIKELKFIALTDEGAAYAGVKKTESRSWGFGSALDLHLSSSVYVIETLLAGNKEKMATRFEPSELQTIFGVEFPPQVPWIVKKHLGRTVVFRAYSGADAADARRTLKELRELEAIGPLIENGDVGFLVLAPTDEAKLYLAKESKPLMKEARIIVVESPNSETVVEYVNDHYRSEN